MTTGEKVGSVALLLAVSVGIYYKFFRKGQEVAKAAQDTGGGGGGGGAAPGGVAHELIRVPVMVADVSPVITPRPMAPRPSAPAPAPTIKPVTSSGAAIALPKPILKGAVKYGADGYQWKSDY